METEAQKQARLAQERAAAGVQSGVPVVPMTVTTKQGPSSTSSKLVPDKALLDAEAKIEEAKQARIDAVNMQADAEKEADMNRALTAQAEGEAIKRDNDRMMAMENERKQRLADWDAQEQAQQRNVEAASKPTGYFQDMTTMRRFLAGLFMGAGDAVGSDGPRKIYEQYAAEDRQAKQAALASEVQKMQRLGKSRDLIQDFYNQEAARIQREEIANGKIAVKQIEATARLKPQWAAKAEQAKAEILQDTATKEIAHRKDMLTKREDRSGSKSVTETAGKDSGGGSVPKQTAKDEEEAIVADYNQRLFEQARDIAKNKPEKVKALNEAYKADLEQKSLDKSGLKGALNLAKGGGMAPTAIDQRIKDPDVRVLYRAAEMAGAMTAKSIDSGALSDATLEKGGAIIGASSADAPTLQQTFAEQAEKQKSMAGAKRQYRAVSPPAPAQPPAEQPAPSRPANNASLSADLVHVLNHPNDPRAEAALRAAGREDLIPQLEKMRARKAKK